jgi:HEAT repeat protein
MDSHIEELIAVLRAGDEEARAEAASQLGAAGADAIAPLIGVLRDYATFEDYEANPKPYYRAEDVLIDIGEPAVQPLIAALNDETWGARAGAVWALGKIGDVRAVQPLIEALRWGDAGSEVVEMLVGFGDIIVRPLAFALKNHESEFVRRGAAHMLGEFADPESTPVLISALEGDADEETRVMAIRALGKRRDARAVEPLIAVLGDPSPMLREASARALGEIGAAVGGTRIREALALALHDSDWGTQQSAAEMLMRMGGEWQESAEALLLGDLQNSDVEIRLGAAWSLVELGDERALDPLLRLLYHQENRIAAAAAFGLGELGDHRAVQPLTAALEHADEAVREAVRAGLRRLGHSV